MLIIKSAEGDLERIKQIFAYVNQENISVEEMGGITYEFKRTYAPKLLFQMLHYNQREAVKLPAFLASEIPSILCSMSRQGELEKIKQIFTYVNQENISVEEMGVQNNEVNQGNKPTLVDTNCGFYGSTPLMSAASNGHHEVCEYLIKHEKANVKAKDEDGDHAAYSAAYNGKLYALKMLVENDGDVIDLRGPAGETPLIAASRCDRADVCKYLVEEKNANVNLKDDDGLNALQYAIDKPPVVRRWSTSNNQQIIEILRFKGAGNQSPSQSQGQSQGQAQSQVPSIQTFKLSKLIRYFKKKYSNTLKGK